MSKQKKKTKTRKTLLQKKKKTNSFFLKRLEHPSIVKLLGICTQPFSIILEYIPFGDLHTHIHDLEKEMSWLMVLRFALDIALGLKYLHCKLFLLSFFFVAWGSLFPAHGPQLEFFADMSLAVSTVHRDIKSPNIMISSLQVRSKETCCKIVDFGTAKTFMKGFTFFFS